MILLGLTSPASAADMGEDGFADSDGVKIHFVTTGNGPLVVLLHGFPDYWYTWRDQLPALAKTCRVVAFDLRGYNECDKPEFVTRTMVQWLSPK